MRRAYSVNPKSATVCSLIGACLLVTGDAPAAVKFFESATHLEPDNAQGWVNLAAALSSSGPHKRAQECADKAIAIDPRSSAALASLAAAQFDTGQIEAAIATYRKAVALENPSSHAHSEFANALFFSGRYDEAMNHYRQAIKINGNDAVARWRYAIAQCRPFYSAAIEIEPSRRAFSECLEDLQTWFQSARHPEAYTAVGSSPPFYLAYQPFSNRDLLTRHGDLCAKWMASMPTDALTYGARVANVGEITREEPQVALGHCLIPHPRSLRLARQYKRLGPPFGQSAVRYIFVQVGPLERRRDGACEAGGCPLRRSAEKLGRVGPGDQ